MPKGLKRPVKVTMDDIFAQVGIGMGVTLFGCCLFCCIISILKRKGYLQDTLSPV